MRTIIAGDFISFKTNSFSDSPTLQGVLINIESLGLVTIIDGVQYELNKLLNVEKIK